VGIEYPPKLLAEVTVSLQKFARGLPINIKWSNFFFKTSEEPLNFIEKYKKLLKSKIYQKFFSWLCYITVYCIFCIYHVPVKAYYGKDKGELQLFQSHFRNVTLVFLLPEISVCVFMHHISKRDNRSLVIVTHPFFMHVRHCLQVIYSEIF
jgi:hypothetical protein